MFTYHGAHQQDKLRFLPFFADGRALRKIPFRSVGALTGNNAALIE